MRAFGVDPGVSACGWAVVERIGRGKYRLVEADTIRTKQANSAAQPDPQTTLESRVSIIAGELAAVADDHEHYVVAAEALEVRRQRGERINPASLIGPAMVLGAVISAHWPVLLIRASDWRRAIGAGHGTPAEVRTAVERHVGVVHGSVHAVDACGVALAALERTR